MPPNASHRPLLGGLPPSPQSSALCEIIPTFLVLCSLQTKSHNYPKLGQLWDIYKKPLKIVFFGEIAVFSKY